MCQKKSKKQLPESTTEQLPPFCSRRHWRSPSCLPADVDLSAERLWGARCLLQMMQRKHFWASIYWRFILIDWVFIPGTHLSWGFPCPQIVVKQNSVLTICHTVQNFIPTRAGIQKITVTEVTFRNHGCTLQLGATEGAHLCLKPVPL